MTVPRTPKPRRRHLRIVGIGALVAALAACSSSPQKVAEEARRIAGSWGATISEAAERWDGGEISTRYFQSVITQARDALQRESDTARESGGHAAAAPVEAVAARVDAIAGALRRGDRPAVIEAAHAAASSVPADKTPPVARPQ